MAPSGLPGRRAFLRLQTRSVQGTAGAALRGGGGSPQASVGPHLRPGSSSVSNAGVTLPAPGGRGCMGVCDAAGLPRTAQAQAPPSPSGRSRAQGAPRSPRSAGEAASADPQCQPPPGEEAVALPAPAPPPRRPPATRPFPDSDPTCGSLGFSGRLGSRALSSHRPRFGRAPVRPTPGHAPFASGRPLANSPCCARAVLSPLPESRMSSWRRGLFQKQRFPPKSLLFSSVLELKAAAWPGGTPSAWHFTLSLRPLVSYRDKMACALPEFSSHELGVSGQEGPEPFPWGAV